jgi:hypothetical protein
MQFRWRKMRGHATRRCNRMSSQRRLLSCKPMAPWHLAVVTATLGGTIAVAPISAALATTPTVAVPWPPANPADGQTVTVSGTGFPGRPQDPTGLEILECADPGGTATNLPSNASACEGTTEIIVNPNQIDANGSFSAHYTIVALNPSNSSIVCDQTHFCVLWVGIDFNTFSQPGATAFSAPFEVGGPSAPCPDSRSGLSGVHGNNGSDDENEDECHPEPLPSPTVSTPWPPGNPTDGQIVTVSGEDFLPPSQDPTGLQIIQCSDPGGLKTNLPSNSGSCEGRTFGEIKANEINAKGDFAVSYTVQALDPSNSSIVCDRTHFVSSGWESTSTTPSCNQVQRPSRLPLRSALHPHSPPKSPSALRFLSLGCSLEAERSCSSGVDNLRHQQELEVGRTWR